MKIAFLGDSITAGGLDFSYVNVLQRELPITVLNYGIGGTRIAKQKQPSSVSIYDSDFQSRVDKIKACLKEKGII